MNAPKLIPINVATIKYGLPCKRLAAEAKAGRIPSLVADGAILFDESGIPGTPYLFCWRIEGGVSRYPWNKEAALAFKSKGRRVSRIVGRAFCQKLPVRAQEETPAGLGPRGTDRAGHW